MNNLKPNRRQVLKLVAGSATLQLVPLHVPLAIAQNSGRHGLSVFGDLKYASDFKQFDYVNPDAPQGGSLVFTPGYWYNNQNYQTFNTLNGFVTKGDAPPRVEYCFSSLMTRAFDEPDAMYGLVANTVEVSDDGSTYIFTLRPEARFHDGSPLTAEDVVWSMNTLKEHGHPSISLPLKPVKAVNALDSHQLEVVFDGTQSKQLALTVAGLPIFSKKYYADRDFTESTLDPPLGSGPYKFGKMSPPNYIEYERVEDYWARDLPVSRGHFNFDVLRIEFYRERQTAFEAFKKGNLSFREEFTSKSWATEYNFPAIEDGRVIKTVHPGEKRPSFQVFHINTRRKKFSNPLTRKALDLCFDFEWTNKNIFYDAYSRSSSYFQNSVLAASGLPEGDELKLLEPFRDQLLPSVFEEAYVPPVSDGSGSDRKILRQAAQMLQEAGWKRDGGVLVDEAGEPFEVEFLIRSPTFERVLAKFVESLESLGIKPSIRLVDPPQFQSRTNDFDFDIVGTALSLSLTPLEGLDTIFGSEGAQTPGSRNYSGIENSVVDALIEKVSASQTREEMTIAVRALDRVLRAYHYSIPNWHSEGHRIAYWDKYDFPETKADYFWEYEFTWWEDPDKAAKLESGG